MQWKNLTKKTVNSNRYGYTSNSSVCCVDEEADSVHTSTTTSLAAAAVSGLSIERLFFTSQYCLIFAVEHPVESV